MSGYTYAWIDKAVETLKIRPDAFSQLYDKESAHILKALKDRYLKGRDPLFWWEMYQESQSIQMEAGYTLLPALCPDNEVYFIPHGERHERVYCSNPDVIVSVLGECPGFEYSVAGLALDWLVTENHHDFMIAVGERAIAKMKLLTTSTMEARKDT